MQSYNKRIGLKKKGLLNVDCSAYCNLSEINYLIEVIQSLVEISLHSGWGFVGNFDRGFQNSLRNNMGFPRGSRFG